MMLRYALASLAAIAAVAPASAVTVFSEDFNNVAAFKGSTTYIASGDADAFSDRFGPTSYYSINSTNGWSFSGSTPIYALNGAGTDGALLLNETSGAASRLITGLVVGRIYKLSLLLSGDNRPTDPYSFNAVIGGSSINAVSFDLASGANPGSLLSVLFAAATTSVTLSLSQTPSLSQASPMIDNISVASVPEPLTWGMMVIGFGAMGAVMRRRRPIDAFTI